MAGVKVGGLENLDDDFIAQLQEFFSHDDIVQKGVIDQIQNTWRREMIDVFHKNADLLKKKLDESDIYFEKLKENLQLLRETKVEKPSIDWVQKSRTHLQAKEFRPALECAQKVITESKSPDLDLLVLAGTAALHCKEFSEAEIYAEQALMADRDNVKAVMLKGLIHYAKKEFEIALQVFERASVLRPESAAIKKYLKLAASYLNTDPIGRDAQGFLSMTNIVDPSERREFARVDTKLELTINDFESMTSLVVKTISLSAGGCRTEKATLPEEFHFSLDLGDGKVVHGYAKKAHVNKEGEVGVRFTTISPEDQELINTRIISGVYGKLG